MSVVWKCPKCGAILRKGSPYMEKVIKSGGKVTGTATCANCGAQYSQHDVYSGRYDVLKPKSPQQMSTEDQNTEVVDLLLEARMRGFEVDLDKLIKISKSTKEANKSNVKHETKTKDEVQQRPQKSEEKKRMDIYGILMDAICCVICADKKVTTKENKAVYNILEKTKAPWGGDEIDNRIRSFIERVNNEGLNNIIQQTCDKLPEFKKRKQEHILLRCVEYMMRCDGVIDENEKKICQKFRLALETTNNKTSGTTQSEKTDVTSYLRSSNQSQIFCDICNKSLEHSEGYALHGKLVSKINYISEITRKLASSIGFSVDELQANLMAKAKVDTKPWLVCNSCVVHFLGTKEEKANAHSLAMRHVKGEKIPTHLLPATSSLLKDQKRPAQNSRVVTCQKCLKQVEYEDNLTHCPFCLSSNPAWPLVIALNSPDKHPGYCVICTSLLSSDIDVNWTLAVVQITIGTLLGMQKRSDIEIFYAKIQARGFNVNVITDVPQADIKAGKCDDQTKQLVDLATKGEFINCVPIITLDPIKHSGLLRFCFYLKPDKSTSNTKNLIDPFF